MKLGKHIFGVGAMTGISRIFGFIRDMLIARYLGAGRLSDVFLAAFKLPNLFRDLLGEGALSAIFIPMYTDLKKDDAFAKNVFSWLMVALLGITLVFEICMPLVIWVLAPGFADDPGKMQLTVQISRIMFFYVIFVCAAAFLSAILNAHSRFLLAAFMPVLLNIMLIAALAAAPFYADGIILYVMAATVVLSGVIQCLVLLGRIRRRHFGLHLVVPKWTPGIKSLFRQYCRQWVLSNHDYCRHPGRQLPKWRRIMAVLFRPHCAVAICNDWAGRRDGVDVVDIQRIGG